VLSYLLNARPIGFITEKGFEAVPLGLHNRATMDLMNGSFHLSCLDRLSEQARRYSVRIYSRSAGNHRDEVFAVVSRKALSADAKPVEKSLLLDIPVKSRAITTP